jgi:hypothetical protein
MLEQEAWWPALRLFTGESDQKQYSTFRLDDDGLGGTGMKPDAYRQGRGCKSESSRLERTSQKQGLLQCDVSHGFTGAPVWARARNHIKARPLCYGDSDKWTSYDQLSRWRTPSLLYPTTIFSSPWYDRTHTSQAQYWSRPRARGGSFWRSVCGEDACLEARAQREKREPGINEK